jgi:uncharacterized phage protein gp47/JayE
VIPSQAAILAGALADVNAAFGNNLNITNLNTPQGQLASSMAAIVSNSYAAIALMVTNMDPDVASGFMQDAVARIYFLNRNAGVATAVECLCTGLAGTVIPAGALALDTSGNIYVCTQGGTIGVGGNVTLEFQNQVLGPIACPSNTLTQIYQTIPGWDSINNTGAGTVGANVETQAEFALRRAATVAANSQGALASIYGAVFEIPGVIDVYCYENVTSGTINVGSTSYSMLPNSIYVGVVGGAATAIAQAIFTKKSPGCNMNGNTSETVTDTSGYQTPVPTYTITFNIPTPTAIKFAVSIKNTTAVPSNINTLVQNAIIAQFTGGNGAPRARIGSLLLVSDFYPAVLAAIGPNVSLLSMLLGTGSATLTNLQLGVDQGPTLQSSDIVVSLV